MELIEMKDFVLTPMLDLICKKTLEKLEPYQYHNYSHSCNIKYAKFLNRELKIWMFIPCDKDGKILEKPLHIFSDHPDEEKSLMYQKSPLTKAYVEAKEKCLFEGFKIIGTGNWCDEVMYELESDDGTYLIYDPEEDNFQNVDEEYYSTINDLTKYKIILTELVNKILGL